MQTIKVKIPIFNKQTKACDGYVVREINPNNANCMEAIYGCLILQPTGFITIEDLMQRSKVPVSEFYSENQLTSKMLDFKKYFVEIVK